MSSICGGNAQFRHTHRGACTYALRTIFENVEFYPDSVRPGWMYVDFESCYSADALVLPSRCAEAVKLSRLGHNRERKGRGVHPPGDVVGTQRDIRRHVRCRATDGELRQLPRSSSDGSTSERKDPFLTNGGEINWITVPARAANVASERTTRPSQATAHDSIETNRSDAERK
jgi:hypothetical protein